MTLGGSGERTRCFLPTITEVSVVAMEVDGGVAVVIETEGPRTAFRYSTGSWSVCRPLFEALAPEAFAKLFCTKRAFVTMDLQIDDDIFVSCPMTAKRHDDEEVVLSVVWASKRGTVSVEALRGAAADVAAALAHEEDRVGYVSREAKVLLSAEHRQAAMATSSLARSLRDAADIAFRRGSSTTTTTRVRFNDWIDVDLNDLIDEQQSSSHDDDDDDDSDDKILHKDELQSKTLDDEDDHPDDDNTNGIDDSKKLRQRSHHHERQYRPYETVLLVDDVVEVPLSATPQLRALVSKADPRKSFGDLAEDLGLSLRRVTELASHLVRWQKARIAGAVRLDSVYAATRQSGDPAIDAALAAFGPARSLRDAAQRLAVEDPMAVILRAIKKGFLTELHTYAIRIEGLPSADLAKAASEGRRSSFEKVVDPLKLRKRGSSPETESDFVIGMDLAAPGGPAVTWGGDERSLLKSKGDGGTWDGNLLRPPRSAADTKRFIDLFRKLSPYFDGRHSVVEMAWREHIDIPEINAVLRAFKSLVVTVQR